MSFFLVDKSLVFVLLYLSDMPTILALAIEYTRRSFPHPPLMGSALLISGVTRSHNMINR